MTYRLINRDRNAVIAARVLRANGFWARTIGLLGRRSLQPDEGLWINPCNGFHTFGMRFPIDVIVLDGNMRVIHIIHALLPLRITRPVKGGRSVVELAAWTAGSIEVGDRLEFELSE